MNEESAPEGFHQLQGGTWCPSSMFNFWRGLVAPPEMKKLDAKKSSAGLGVLMLLRRRMPLIICSDACEACWGCWGEIGTFFVFFVGDWKLRFSPKIRHQDAGWR